MQRKNYLRSLAGALWVALCLLFAGPAQGQCPPGNVELETQAEVDAFVAAYPSFTEIAGHLGLGGISSDPITDISGLSSITSITEPLLIGYTGMSSLDGLDNLAAVGTSKEFGSVSIYILT